MFFIIHRCALKPGKTYDDLRDWMRKHEAVQAKWGAVEADIYRPFFGEADLFFLRYKLKSLDHWHQGINGPEGRNVLRALAEIADLNKLVTYVMEEIPY